MASKNKKLKHRDSLSTNVYSITGKVVGKVSLPKQLFAASVNPKLVSQAVRVYLANKRAGVASTKGRGEVRGSTRKVWRQKHTGRARHGSIRAPIFVGGGVVFGPKPRDYSLTLPKAMKRKALYSALSIKLRDKNIRIIDGLEKVPPKTKKMAELLTKLSDGQKQKVLLVLSKGLENIQRAGRNIKGVTVSPVNLLNVYQVVKADTLIFTKAAIEGLAKTYGNK